MTTDLAARYLYRRSHSARNSRSSGDHGGSTSLKLILTQPKSALVKQYQPLFEMGSIACPSVSIVCNPPGHACAPLCLGMRAAPLKMLCGIPAARGRSTQKRDAEAGTAKGRGLPFRGGHGPKAIRGQGGSELFDPVCCPTRPHRVSPPHSADVLLGCRECTIIPIIACSHTVRPAWSRVCPPPLQAS